MAYGLRLRLEHDDFLGKTTRFDISKRDYTGIADVRTLEGKEPAKITYGDKSAAELPTIYGSELVLQFFAEFDMEFLYLFTADSKEYRVDKYYDSALVWSGFIAPENWSEPLIATPYQVTATATDGLGNLKNVTFPDYTDGTTRLSIIKIIAVILQQTGLQLPINTCIDWQEVEQTAGTDAMAEHYETIKPLAGKSSYEVLTDQLPNCRIFQRLGQWWVISYSALQDDTITYNNYDASGTLVEADKTIGVKASGYWIENEPNLDILPAIKQLIVIQDFGLNDNLIDNGSFTKYDPDINEFDGWTNVLVTPQQRKLDTDGNKYVYLPGSQYPGAFADHLFGNLTKGIKKEFRIKQTESIFKMSLSYALMSEVSSPLSASFPASMMFIQVKLIASGVTYYLRRKPYVEKSPEFEWSIYSGTTPMGDDKITLGSGLKKSSAAGHSGEYYNTYNVITPYTPDQIGDHFNTFSATTPGIPASGTLEITMYVAYTNTTKKGGACYTGLEVNLLDEEEESYPTQESYKVVNDANNNYKPEDLTITIGDYPDIQNAEIIYKYGLQRADESHTTAWSIPSSANNYTFAELIARLISAQQVLPRQVYSIRLTEITPTLAMIISDINETGLRLLETGMTYDNRMAAVEGNYIELPLIDIDNFDVEVATEFDDKTGTAVNTAAPSTSTAKPVNTEKAASIVDANGTLVDAPGYFDGDYFYGETSEDDGITRIKSLKRLIDRNPITDYVEPIAVGSNSVAIGEGVNTSAFREILLGSFPTEPTANTDEWVETDRIFGIGNGVDAETREMAVEVFKSGLIKLFNALQLGDYAHGTVDPANGTLRYTSANGLEIRHGGAWVEVINQKPIQVTGITLTSTSWTLVSGLYEYDLANSNITANSIVDIIPMNSTIDIAIAAIVLPETDSSTGSVKLYAKNEPTADIDITINIEEKAS